MMNANRVLLMQLSERTSARGNRYLAGWLGKAGVVAFRGEPDKYGNETWDLFVATPEPKPEPRQRSAARDDAAGEVRSEEVEPSSASTGTATTSTKWSARPEERGAGWRGPSVYRRPSAPRPAAVADDEDLVEDGLADLYQ
jgi:hypothetical protein